MLTMIENIIKKLMKCIYVRHETGLKWESSIPPAINRLLQKVQHKRKYLDPLRCGEWEFEVVDGKRQFVVDFQRKEL
ncbi:hypothetical protein ACOSP7_031569 [Xanthoceras sorbifolium]